MTTPADPHCDRSIAESGPETAAAPTHPRLVLAATILASSLAFIDGSIVNVGLPAIGAGLGADGASLSWVVNAYLLPLSALLLFGGAAGDRYGRKRLLVVGIAVFAAASLVCAVAGTIGWLLAGRALQGVGAALLMPNSLAILGTAFSGEARGRAIGTWAAVGAAAGAIGPVLGGWLIDAFGWRTMFVVNLPVAVAAAAIAWRVLPDRRDAARAPLDLAGASLATLALGALTWGLTALSESTPSALVATLSLVGGSILFVVFVAVEHRRGARAMLPLALFSSRRFAGLTLLTFLLYGALGALLVLLPTLLIRTHGYSAVAAGAALLPLPIVIALASSSVGRLAVRVGARTPLTVGPLIVAAGFVLATRIAGPGDYWTTILPALAIVSIGMAGAVAPLTTAVLGSVDAGHTGTASGLNSAVARSGGLIATASLGVVLGSSGAALDGYFVAAMLACAASAVAAAGCAFFGLAEPAVSN